MKVAKSIGVVSIIAGIIMFIAGAVTWGMVSSQLAAEKITVPGDAAAFAGAEVKGPLTAYFQADTINKHATKMSEGLTYAELGAKVKEAEAANDTETAEKYQAMRNTVMNGSFLRASLFTSVLAFGVSALVMGLGLMFALLGWAFIAIKGKPAEAVRAEA